MKRKREDQERLSQALNGAQHIIIKRDPAEAEHDHLGDYGKLFTYEEKKIKSN